MKMTAGQHEMGVYHMAALQLKGKRPIKNARPLTTICPFTLEPTSFCVNNKRTSIRRLCCYTLEPCAG